VSAEHSAALVRQQCAEEIRNYADELESWTDPDPTRQPAFVNGLRRAAALLLVGLRAEEAAPSVAIGELAATGHAAVRIGFLRSALRCAIRAGQADAAAGNPEAPDFVAEFSEALAGLESLHPAAEDFRRLAAAAWEVP